MSSVAGVSTATPSPIAQTAVDASINKAQAGSVNQPQIAGGNAAQPAAIVSLSQGAAQAATMTASIHAALPSMDPQQVSHALYMVSGANGSADIANHWDYQAVLAEYGKAIANRDQAAVDGEAGLATSFAQSSLSGLPIPTSKARDISGIKNGPNFSLISVGAFSFTNGGSIYTVTPGKDGTLVGTRNGQAWQTWNMTAPGDVLVADNGAKAALATLKAAVHSNITTGKS